MAKQSEREQNHEAGLEQVVVQLSADHETGNETALLEAKHSIEVVEAQSSDGSTFYVAVDSEGNPSIEATVLPKEEEEEEEEEEETGMEEDQSQVSQGQCKSLSDVLQFECNLLR